MDGSDAYLFHYTTRDAAFGHILPERRLRFSPYERMRDPLENKRWAFVAVGRDRDREPIENVMAVSAFHGHADEIRSSAKLLSLTQDAVCGNPHEERFARGWSRARMWEQYAERHGGVCLVFRMAKLAEAIVASLEGQGLASPYHRPVEYDAAGFAASRRKLDLDTLHQNSSAESVRRWVQANKDTLFFLKAPDWRTEYEYRFVVTLPDVEFVYADIGDALEAVIVGEKFPEWQHPVAALACSRAGAEFKRLGWGNGYPAPYTPTTGTDVNL